MKAERHAEHPGDLTTALLNATIPKAWGAAAAAWEKPADGCAGRDAAPLGSMPAGSVVISRGVSAFLKTKRPREGLARPLAAERTTANNQEGLALKF